MLRSVYAPPRSAYGSRVARSRKSSVPSPLSRSKTAMPEPEKAVAAT